MQAIHQQITASPERDTLMGMDGWRIPATGLRSDVVLHNNIGKMTVPQEEIAASVSRWDMTPVTMGHPRERGVPKSGREERTVNEKAVGFLTNSREVDGELKTDVFLPDHRVEEFGLEESVLEPVQNGTPIDVSTSFSGDFEEQGDRIVGRRLEPDHFALLLDERGACSTEDGCGLGINAISRPEFSGTTTADWSAPTLSEWINAIDADASEWEELTQEQKEQIASGYLERINLSADQFDDAVGFPVVEPGSRNLSRNALENAKARARFAENPDRLRSIADNLLEEEFDVDTEDAENVADTVVNRIKDWFRDEVQPEEGTMSEEQIAELSEATGLGEEALQDMEDDSLESLAENVLEEKPSEGGDGQAENADETDTDEPPEWAENIMDRLDKLEESAEPAINEMQQKRNRLVSEVAQNSSFEEEELQGRSVEELEKLRSLAKNETYTGRGGPKGGGGDEIPEYIEPPSVFTDQDEE